MLGIFPLFPSMTAQCRFPIDDLGTAHAFLATVIWFHLQLLSTVSTGLDACGSLGQLTP